ncbi:hypothetical protein WICPIJ_003138 [Wickerhamomyces pijperi]|uniref:Uncharacterized protein n=1 Tax=Wickerhamomyces pijperi TaxID=599730 RepID=A0A9P8QA98_WICPI|nr:hypothetical protein WICPIJ_003138 [Wickerhamomyces pijperi]
MKNDNCYPAANLYPQVAPLLQGIQHSLNIYKLQTDITELTKFREGDYTLLDEIMTLSPIENIRPSSALSAQGNFYIKFQALVLNLNAGHHIRMTELFQSSEDNLLDRTAEAYYTVKKCFARFDTIVRQTG